MTPGPEGPGRRGPWSHAGRLAFAALFIAAGVAHFRITDRFAKVVPPYIPHPRAMVWLSGIAEITLGALLLVPATSRLAAWGLVALLIAVFPANIYIYQHQELLPVPAGVPNPGLWHLLRLPMQGLLILWAYAYTRR